MGAEEIPTVRQTALRGEPPAHLIADHDEDSYGRLGLVAGVGRSL